MAPAGRAARRLPAGHGDAQLTLAQVLDFDGAVVVTTPSPLAFADVVKGIALFDEVDVPVVGVVENMGSVADARGGAKAAAFAARHGLSAAAAAGIRGAARGAPRPVRRLSARKLRAAWGIEDVVEVPLLPALGPTPVGFAGPREAPAERTALAAYDDLARHLMEFLARGARRRRRSSSTAPRSSSATRTGRRAWRRWTRAGGAAARSASTRTAAARGRGPAPPADVVEVTLKRTGNVARRRGLVRQPPRLPLPRVRPGLRRRHGTRPPRRAPSPAAPSAAGRAGRSAPVGVAAAAGSLAAGPTPPGTSRAAIAPARRRRRGRATSVRRKGPP